ncbi:MAG TPA: hypothetical protein EYG85_06245 [Crocinitomix sp.]|nr:hypothetical protein [Crocinitomix sp.]
MKKVFIIATLMLGLSYTSNAQQKSTAPAQTQQSDHRTDAEKLESYKAHLKALDEKEAWIRSIPSEVKIAQEQGWFEKAATTRKELKAKIAELENKTKK